MSSSFPAGYEKALQVGRPPNIMRLFPNSKALIVSGKVIDRAMGAKPRIGRANCCRPPIGTEAEADDID